jgi:hypothetical protein
MTIIIEKARKERQMSKMNKKIIAPIIAVGLGLATIYFLFISPQKEISNAQKAVLSVFQKGGRVMCETHPKKIFVITPKWYNYEYGADGKLYVYHKISGEGFAVAYGVKCQTLKGLKGKNDGNDR